MSVYISLKMLSYSFYLLCAERKLNVVFQEVIQHLGADFHGKQPSERQITVVMKLFTDFLC